MNRLFNYQAYLQRHPISHEVLVERLFKQQFEPWNNKQRELSLEKVSTVINAAFKLSRLKGFAEMSMRDLTKESGVSIGSIYAYFDSKAGLADTVTRALHHVNEELLPLTLRPELSQQEQLESLIRSYIYLGDRLKNWFLFVFNEYKNLPADTQRKALENEIHYQSYLDEIFGQANYPSDQIIIMIQDWFVKDWKYKDVDVDLFADRVVHIAQVLLSNNIANKRV